MFAARRAAPCAWFLSVAAVLACSDNASRPDAAVLDAAPDAAVLDAAPDAAIVDAAPDAAIVDAALDAPPVDAAVDAPPLDAAPDAVQLDAAPPDAMVCRELVCGVTRLAPTGDLDTRGLASDGTHVYWSNDRAGPVARSGRRRSGRADRGGPGAERRVLAGLGRGPRRDPRVLGVSATPARCGGERKSGGAVEPLITGQDGINRLALTATEVLWTNDHPRQRDADAEGGRRAGGRWRRGRAAPTSWRIDATHVYWADGLGGAVRRAPLAGGAVETVASGGSPSLLELDATDVYWLDEATEQVLRRPKAGGTTTPVTTGPDRVYGFTIDGTNLYWTTDLGLSRRPKTLATAAVMLASCFPDPFYPPYLLRVNGATLYWATRYLNAPDGVQQVAAQATCM
jgi:hypothetical protein